ncbi:MAG: hypothetical protein RMN52_07825 [Anaerolineae bacterium]|nr:hypothetical protein [Candidatus Roseilinea sp.]MDW8449896.1 hypothetical protein [Anaerolineae bacterium]
MDVVKKVLAVLAMILAVVGILICVAGVIGAWALNASAKQVTAGALAAVEAYSALGSEAAQTVSSSVGEIRSVVDQMNQTLTGTSGADQAQALASVKARLNETIAPRLERAIETARTVEQTALSINQTLESVNRLPGVNVPTFGDELQLVGTRLRDVATSVEGMRTTLAESNLDQARLQAATNEAAARLGAVETSLGVAQTRLAALSAASADVKARVPGWFDILSLVISSLFILFGLGQFFLFKAGLDGLRRA